MRWTKWHWERLFFEYLVFPCQFHSTNAPRSSSSLTRRQMRKFWESSKKQCSVGNRWALDWKTLSRFFFRFWTVKMVSEVFIETGNTYRLLWNSISPENSRYAIVTWVSSINFILNHLTPNDPYRGRTAPLTSKVTFHVFIQQI